MSQSVDYYRVLGVLDDAEDIVIRAAYRALAQRYHPDRWTGDITEAHRRMVEINTAYAVLSVQEKRREYDVGRSPNASHEPKVNEDPRPHDAYKRTEPHNDKDIYASAKCFRERAGGADSNTREERKREPPKTDLYSNRQKIAFKIIIALAALFIVIGVPFIHSNHSISRLAWFIWLAIYLAYWAWMRLYYPERVALEKLAQSIKNTEYEKNISIKRVGMFAALFWFQ